jgi:hypothetical protein
MMKLSAVPSGESMKAMDGVREAWAQVFARVGQAADDYERWLWRPEQKPVAHQALAELHERVRRPAADGDLLDAWDGMMRLLGDVPMGAAACAELAGAWRCLAWAGHSLVRLAGQEAGWVTKRSG